MQMRRAVPRGLRRWLSLLLALSLSACGGKGCAEVITAPPKPLVPTSLMIPGAMVTRLTQRGFDVIAGQTIELLGLLFGKTAGGAAKIDVTSLLGPIELKVGGGLGLFEGKTSVRDLLLSLSMDSLTISLVEGSAPARIRLGFDHARLGVVSGVVAGGSKVLGLSTDAACHLLDGIDVGGGASRVATVSATVDVILGVDDQGALDLGVVVAKPVLHEIGFLLGQDCSLVECTDKVLAEDPCLECSLCAAGELGSAAIAGFADLLGPLLSGLLEASTALLLDQLLLPGINGKPLDLEVPLDVRAMMAGSSAALAAVLGPSEPLRVRVRPPVGAFSVSGGALNATLTAGAWAAAHPCTLTPGADATDAFTKLPLMPTAALPTTVHTPTGEADVDLGVLVAAPLLEEIAWAALRSGLACVHAHSPALHHISKGAIALNAGVVDLVVPGLRRLVPADAAIALGVVPSAAPPPPTRVTLTAVKSATGGPDAVRATVRLIDVGVTLDVEARWRWLTLFEARADLDLTLIFALVGGKLDVKVEHVAIADLDVRDAALVEVAGLPGVASALVDVAVALLFAEPLALALDVESLLDGFALPLTARPLSVGVLGDGGWLWLAIGIEAKAAP